VEELAPSNPSISPQFID
jgi:hypothetical protein